MSTVASGGQATTVIDDLHFGECLRWREGSLYFSDMYGDRVQRYDPDSSTVESVADLFHPAGIGWLPNGSMLVVATEDKRIFEISEDGNRPYADLTDLAPGWTNDMLVDRQGRAYVGNFGYDLFSEEPRATQLILVRPDRSAVKLDHDLVFPNGMALRSDGRLIVAETFAQRLALFAVEDDGALTPDGAIALDEDIYPDGICIDAEDAVWLASVFSQEVVRVEKDGTVERVPVSQNAYACMLGGEDRRTLYVATAPDHEPENRRARAEGRIEAVRVTVPGVGGEGLGL
jgi:sugar lactone lactonase YvrE